MRQRSLLFLSLLGSLMALLPSLAEAETLLDQTFSQNERPVQDLPTSAAWFTNAHMDSFGVADGKLELGKPGVTAIAYFTQEGSAVKLEEGDTLVLETEFTIREPAGSRGSSVRIGFFNSGENRVTADAKDSTWNRFMGYTGYATFFDAISNNNASISILRRNADLSDNLIGAGSAFAVSLGSAGGRAKMVDGVSYKLTFSLSFAGGGLTASVLMVGEDGSSRSVEFTDTQDPHRVFDTLVLSGAGTVYRSISYSHIKISGPQPKS